MPKGLRDAHTQRVLACIRERPAQNQRSIARACGYTEGVTRQHLAVLLAQRLVRATPPEAAPRYVPASVERRQMSVMTGDADPPPP